MGRCFIFLLLILPACCLAFNERPWYGRWLEYEMPVSYRFQLFQSLDVGNQTLSYQSSDSFLDAGLSFMPIPQLKSGVDLEFANTRHMSFNFSNAKLWLQYQWLNDIEGDPLSIVTGFLTSFPTSEALNDVAQLFHGNANFELNLLFGKEFSQGWFWNWRIWGLGGLGLANRGSPWMRAKLFWEKNFDDIQQFGFFSQFQVGLGQRNIERPQFFPGYGSIKYRVLDLGGWYHYKLFQYGTLALTYDFRLYAHNAPRYVNTFGFSYLLPFSIY